MKRLLSLLLVLLLCLGLTACALQLPAQPAANPEETDPPLIIITSPKAETEPADRTEAPAQTEASDRTEAPVQTEAPDRTEAPVQTEAPDRTEAPEQTDAPEETEALLDEDGWYNSKEEVALYIHQYGKLPGNYITKKDAEALGWPGGSLEPYAPGMSIGGGYFGNYEGLLPTARGRKYTECDIDTAGQRSRGAKRIVFSNDGLIYYTGDHYESFELLYGDPG